MLQFFSGSSNNVNSGKAIYECLEKAFRNEPDMDCNLIVLFTAMGHNFRELLNEAHRISPGARIIGCTGEGVIGSEGPDESLKAVSVMAVKGPESEFAIAGIDNTSCCEPFEAGARLAKELKNQNDHINTILFYPSLKGLFFNWEKAIGGIESVFGPDIPVFGGIAVDNGKFITDFQFFDDKILEQGAVAAGFADDTLEARICSNHGLEALEMPFLVTGSEGNRIMELDGKAAWSSLTEMLDLPDDTSPMEIFPFSSIVRELPVEDQSEYNSKYIVTSVAIPNPDGSLPSTISMPAGSMLWLTRRNEKKIFRDVDIMVGQLIKKIDNRKPVAVFHSDCTTRGKLSFNQVSKDSIVKKLQNPITRADNVPWSGLYAAGQFAPLGKRNHVHIYTSSLCVLVREE